MGGMSLHEAAERARHDLGKYVCLQTRWLEEGAPDAELREALAADLLRTRRGPEGEETAAQLWARLRVPLAGAEIDEIDALMAALAARAARLDALDSADLRETAALSRRVAEALRDLCRRVGG